MIINYLIILSIYNLWLWPFNYFPDSFDPLSYLSSTYVPLFVVTRIKMKPSVLVIIAFQHHCHVTQLSLYIVTWTLFLSYTFVCVFFNFFFTFGCCLLMLGDITFYSLNVQWKVNLDIYLTWKLQVSVC